MNPCFFAMLTHRLDLVRRRRYGPSQRHRAAPLAALHAWWLCEAWVRDNTELPFKSSRYSATKHEAPRPSRPCDCGAIKHRSGAHLMNFGGV